MTIGGWFIISASLVVLVARMSHVHHVQLMACMLFWMCAISNAITTMWGFGSAAIIYPIMDLAGCAVSCFIYRKYKDNFAAILAFLFLLQNICHLAWALAASNNYQYFLTLNVVFAFQLVTVFLAGGRYVANIVNRHLPHVRGVINPKLGGKR